ncbi:MAG TPA: N-6 DNA methylase [Flavipsychrobacter sp.]|nr:N-6 DNA methylase [Flavipsychrobacter sp.]
MLDKDTKKRIDDARDILVGKVPDPKSQVEQITIALIYKFMDDMDTESVEMGGKATFFTGEYEQYAWTKLFDPKLGSHGMFMLYSEALTKLSVHKEKSFPQLFRDIFKNAYLPYRDPETLKLFLKTIDEFNYDHSERLGDAFEYLLSVLGSQGDAGQFRTPRNIIDFIVAVLDPKKNETICDPACGTAGFLISSYKHILEQNTKKLPGDMLKPDERKAIVKNFKGYDISPDMVRLSLVNMYLHNFSNPQITEYDTLTSEDKWNETFDIIMANPPFMTPKGGIKPHKRFSVESNRSEVLFVDYIAEHINPATGRAGIIVPEGIIFQSATAYKALRKMLVENNYLYAVVSLPAGIFNPYSGVKTTILLMDRAIAKKTDDILFIKIENDGFGLGAQRKEIVRNDLPDALNLLHDYKHAIHNGNTENVTLLPNALVVKKDRIAENEEYNLTIERYVENLDLKNVKHPIVKIGDVFETSSGGTPSKSKPEYYENGTIPWLKSGEVAQGYIYKSEEYITTEGFENSSAKMFPINTVLVAMYGATAGQVGILKFEATTNQAVCGILPNNKVIPEFLYLVLKSQKENLIKLSSGGAQPNISQKIIRDYLIPLPALSLQKDIVDKIDSWQKIVDGAKQVVDNYTPYIEIDPNWEIVELSTICENLDSKRKPVTASERKDGVYPYYGASGIVDYVDSYIFDGDYLLVSEDGANLRARVTPIAFSVSGKVWVNNHAHVLYFKDKASRIFVETYLNSISLDSYITGSAQPKLNQASLNRLKIPFPPLEIQENIVENIEREKSLIESNVEILRIYTQKISDEINKLWI